MRNSFEIIGHYIMQAKRHIPLQAYRDRFSRLSPFRILTEPLTSCQSDHRYTVVQSHRGLRVTHSTEGISVTAVVTA